MCAVAENHNSSNSQPTLKTAPRIAASRNIEETRGGTRIRFAMALSSLSVAIKRRRVFSKTNHKASARRRAQRLWRILGLETEFISEKKSDYRILGPTCGTAGRLAHYVHAKWSLPAAL